MEPTRTTYSLDDVMVDIETLGQGHNAHILSIGAVRFNPNFYEPDKWGKFYRIVMTVQPGAVIDVSTVVWWMGQAVVNPAAAKALFDVNNQPIFLAKALAEFATFCEGATALWSNSPTFDETILRDAAKREGLQFAMSYRTSRDQRTLVALANRILGGLNQKIDIPFNGVPHNALDDAMHQAQIVTHCYGVLFEGKPAPKYPQQQ